MNHHNCKDLLCESPHEEVPVDTGFTDKTILMSCGECSEPIRGIDAMRDHILKRHKTYSVVEAVEYAREWTNTAYEKAIDEMVETDVGEWQEHRD